MNKGIVSLFAFSIGAVVGSIVAFKFAEVKYKNIADEEIASVKERFTVPKPDVKKDAEIKPAEAYTREKPDLKEYASRVKKEGYHDYSTTSTEKKPPAHIKVIKPEEFGEYYEYETECLTFYADKILTDDQDTPIEDVDNVVGYDSLTRFGEYAEDLVYVRNEKYKTDYEISLDKRKYSDVINYDPHLVEDK